MPIYNLPGPKARALIERDRAVISPSYARAYPFVMDHGKGSIVWDVDGNRFLDFAAGIAVNATGHSHPQVVQADQGSDRESSCTFQLISTTNPGSSWVNAGSDRTFQRRCRLFHDQFGHRERRSGHQTGSLSHRRQRNSLAFWALFTGARSARSASLPASRSTAKVSIPLMNGVVHVPYPNPYRPLLASRPGEDYGETVVRYIEEQVLGNLLPAE